MSESDLQALDATIDELCARLEALLELLEECGEPYWSVILSRALQRIEAGELAGLTGVLGAFGVEDGLGTLVLLQDPAPGERGRHLVLNRRLDHLRGTIFPLADRALALLARMRQQD